MKTERWCAAVFRMKPANLKQYQDIDNLESKRYKIFNDSKNQCQMEICYHIEHRKDLNTKKGNCLTELTKNLLTFKKKQVSN